MGNSKEREGQGTSLLLPLYSQSRLRPRSSAPTISYLCEVWDVPEVDQHLTVRTHQLRLPPLQSSEAPPSKLAIAARRDLWRRSNARKLKFLLLEIAHHEMSPPSCREFGEEEENGVIVTDDLISEGVQVHDT